MPLNAHGNVVLVVIDIQGGNLLLNGPEPVEPSSVPQDSDLTAEDQVTLNNEEKALKRHEMRMKRSALAEKLINRCREVGIPPVFIQEVHKPNLVDIGRELDGSEGPHCQEDQEDTKLAWYIKPLPNEFHIQKRRYSAFFATELALVLKSYKADTLILIGGFTDVCVHYTAVDAHQHDFHIRVLTDVVSGSSRPAHDASLKAINYLQRDALCTSDDAFEFLDEYEKRKSA